MTRTPAPAVLLALSLAGCRTAGPAIPVEGVVAGQRVRTTVDSESARDSVEKSLRGEGTIDRAKLREIARKESADLAALLFVEGLRENAANRRAQESYLAHLEKLRRDPRRDWLVSAARGFEVLFAPGWFYRSDPESGADFRAQRELLDRLGIENALVETGENDSVESNAEQLAAALRGRRGSGRPVILISTSKSGPEVALALGDRLRPQEIAHVRAWVNVGGLLRGTPLADAALRLPAGLIAGFALRGRLAGIASLRTRPRRARLENLQIPPAILILNYVAVPFSGGVTPGARSRYRRLVRHGPNDGLTLLADVVAAGGVTVVEPGLDHFFAAPDILERGLALLATVFSELDRERSVYCEGGDDQHFPSPRRTGRDVSHRLRRAGGRHITAPCERSYRGGALYASTGRRRSSLDSRDRRLSLFDTRGRGRPGLRRLLQRLRPRARPAHRSRPVDL
ncbi:MAG: hypothetical protein ABR576_10745 [Thermoanaerobaculia bacterium]